jgi:hypothetical protein
MAEWPPNQPLFTTSNTQFNVLQTPGIFYKTPNNLINVLPREGPNVAGSWIKADPIAGGRFPEWTSDVPANIDQSLYPTDSPTFAAVRVENAMDVRQTIQVDNYINFNFAWRTPPATVPHDNRRGWLTSKNIDETRWEKGNDVLSFATTLPAPTSFTPSIFENFWAFTDSSDWAKFTLPAAAQFQIQDNTTTVAESSWVRIGVNQPQFRLDRESGLFAVDWVIAFAFSPQYNGQLTKFTGGVAVQGVTDPIFNAVSSSTLSSTQNPLTTFPENAAYSTIAGRGYIQCQPGDIIGFFGRIAPQQGEVLPVAGGLFIKTLSVRVRRQTAY